jgi:hypothetical protein
MSLTKATYSMIDGAPVNVLDFGAIGDGVTNDTAAVQAAINFCLASTQARTLVIPSQCYLGSSLTIDRLVDTTTSEFRIVGIGPNAGFKVNGINAFTSTLALVGVQPQSEYVTFEGIRFDGNADVASFAFTERFLRMRFLNCDFAGIRGLNATTFAQEWSFERCRVRNAPAAFFSSQGAYYINSHGSKYQNNTGTIFAINHSTFATGVVGCSFVQDTVEANSVGWLRAGQIYGLLIAGIYSEKTIVRLHLHLLLIYLALLALPIGGYLLLDANLTRQQQIKLIQTSTILCGGRAADFRRVIIVLVTYTIIQQLPKLI